VSALGRLLEWTDFAFMQPACSVATSGLATEARLKGWADEPRTTDNGLLVGGQLGQRGQRGQPATLLLLSDKGMGSSRCDVGFALRSACRSQASHLQTPNACTACFNTPATQPCE
jgi:hypothetical protein